MRRASRKVVQLSPAPIAAARARWRSEMDRTLSRSSETHKLREADWRGIYSHPTSRKGIYPSLRWIQQPHTVSLNGIHDFAGCRMAYYGNAI